jgi:hypothetical protein
MSSDPSPNSAMPSSNRGPEGEGEGVDRGKGGLGLVRVDGEIGDPRCNFVTKKSPRSVSVVSDMPPITQWNGQIATDWFLLGCF